MTDIKPNAELAWRTMDQINAHPELHRQGWWFTRQECGTAACFAGWTCLLSGDTPRASENDLSDESSWVVTSVGTVLRAEDRAIALLGITESAADELFAGGNDREDLRDIVTEIFGPRP